ncbi:MAG: hypothetical protein Q9165_007618 [Trypethelium subeluteriae]
MADHDEHPDHPWYPNCDYICEREELVTSILQQLRNLGVVIIRATPQVGKTTLLRLLGHRIISTDPDLEPVFVYWQERFKRGNSTWTQYLEENKGDWQKANAKVRPYNPGARTVYLIDEAQGSYEEDVLWSELRNHHNLRNQPLFVLVCVYGAAGISRIRNPDVESQARRVHVLHRVELRPSTPGNPSMLFKPEQTMEVIQKWAITHGFQIKDGVSDYLHSATDGHPGMIGLLLSHFQQMLKQVPSIVTTKTFSIELCHNLVVQHENSFVEWLSNWGRGVWSPWSEGYTRQCLSAEVYSHLKLSDIQKALREVATRPQGYTHLQNDFDAFAFCHRQGYLHTEVSTPETRETTFTFPSPLHRRVAYRRLLPGREPDAALRSVSLQQVCINAIARFSPAALQKRRPARRNRSWGIPEAVFQNELYSCLLIELRYLPILSEYSHTKDGRIDFYISDQKWGVEVLQCGSNADIAEHVARFKRGGRYHKWDILHDYVVLNFSPRSALRDIRIQDASIQSHVLLVVVEPDEYTAEIYTHDKQLRKTLTLGEGRLQNHTDYFEGLTFGTADSLASLQDRSTANERHSTGELERMKVQMEQRNMQIEQQNMQMGQQNMQIEQKTMQMEQMRAQMEQQNMQMGQRNMQIEQKNMQMEQMRAQMEQQKDEFQRQLQELRVDKRKESHKKDMMEEKDKSAPIDEKYEKGKKRKR